MVDDFELVYVVAHLGIGQCAQQFAIAYATLGNSFGDVVAGVAA